MFFKPELDKNQIITEEDKQKLQSFLVESLTGVFHPEYPLHQYITNTKELIEKFLLYAYDLYEYDSMVTLSCEDALSFMKSIIDGWKNFVKSELGCVNVYEPTKPETIQIAVQDSRLRFAKRLLYIAYCKTQK
jgi:hypothetical protein